MVHMMNTEAPTRQELDAEEAEEAAELGCTVADMRLAAMNGWTVAELHAAQNAPADPTADPDEPF